MGDIDELGYSDTNTTRTDSITGPIISSGDITFTTTTDSTGGGAHFYDPDGNIVTSGEKIVKEEISEEVQEKINKIGTPGKRNIDDLLKSFKVVADSKKGTPLEELDDQTWMDEVMTMKEEPDTFIPASEDVVSEERVSPPEDDIRIGDESES